MDKKFLSKKYKTNRYDHGVTLIYLHIMAYNENFLYD